MRTDTRPGVGGCLWTAGVGQHGRHAPAARTGAHRPRGAPGVLPPTEQGWSGSEDRTVTLSKGDPAAEVAGEQGEAPGDHGGPAAGWPPPTNTRAIIALCTVFAVPVLGIVFGVMARREIGRTGEAGRAYATWGMALGIAFTAFWVLYLVALLTFFLLAGLGLFTATSGLDGTGSGF